MSQLFKYSLVALTLFAVICDSMLMPFYPTFFSSEFAVSDPKYVGLYVAAIGIVVMFFFPFWAQIAKKIPVLPLLVGTQFAAASLSLACYWNEGLTSFWVLSLTMIAFKASYLLVYPYLMSFEHKSKYTHTIGLLTVVAHFGVIIGAVIGGSILQFSNTKNVFLIMAMGDFIQMLVCLFLISIAPKAIVNKEEQVKKSLPRNRGKVAFLALLMMCFYFSVYLIRPFFAAYWHTLVMWGGNVLAGVIYAIPALMALVMLWKNYRSTKESRRLFVALLLALGGMLLQTSSLAWLFIAGRGLFGLAIFIIMVRLDLILYQISTPDSYASDYSKVHFFQNLGVLISSFTAGLLVSWQGLSMPFWVASLSLGVTLVLVFFFEKSPRSNIKMELPVN